jgi:hypothetical protein
MRPNFYSTTASSFIEIGDAPRLEICNSFMFNQTLSKYATAGRILESQFQTTLESFQEPNQSLE